MRAYIFDGKPGHPTLPHDSGVNVSSQTLSQLGVIVRPNIDEEGVEALAAERGYKCRDEITVSKEGLGDAYETKLKMFFEQHMHEDFEARWIKEGAGYFDVRDAKDKDWIRIRLDVGDLLELPAGIYHRFTLDDTNYTKAVRLFKDAPKWTPLSRADASTDENPYRKHYLETYIH